MLKRRVLACYTIILFSSQVSAVTFSNDVDLSGYVDLSYNYLVKNHQFISTVNDRYNDIAQNGFTLQQAAFTISKQPKQGLGGLFNMVAGRDANSLAPLGWNPYYGSQTLAMMVPQAYLQYRYSAYTFIGGLVQTPIGYESYDSSLDFNFSRSILNSYAEPGYYPELRVLYAASDQLQFNLGVNNGWSGFRDRGRGKSIEAGVKYDVNKDLSLNLQTLTGPERLGTLFVSGPTGVRNMVNVFGTWKTNSRLTLAASVDYAAQAKALAADANITRVSWQGISAYASYQLREQWTAGTRAEWYLDGNGYTTGVAQNWRELTLTLGYKPIESVLLRAETRRDFSNKRAFNNVTGPGAAYYQQSFALEGMYLWL